jgi:hypothetical protein
MTDRRARIHALVLALLGGQEDLGLLEEDHAIRLSHGRDAGGQGGWLERNQRLVKRYQALVRTAITIDALIEQEIGLDQLEQTPPAAAVQRDGLDGKGLDGKGLDGMGVDRIGKDRWGDSASIRSRKARKDG